MSSLAERLARPEILELKPFDIAAAANAAFGADAIKLDANENPYPPLSDGPLATTINRYPEPQPARLRASMAALYGVEPDALVITRGADDAIDMLIRAFCRPGMDAVAITKPTFTAYEHFARLQGARVIEAPLDFEFDFDADAYIAAVGGRSECEARLHLLTQQSDRQRGGPGAGPESRGCAVERLSSSSTRPISTSRRRRASPRRRQNGPTSSC